MAQPLHLSVLRSARPSICNLKYGCQAFSHLPVQYRRAPAPQKQRQPAQPSIRVNQNIGQALSASMKLLPSTLIPLRPSFFQDPRKAFTVSWIMLKHHARNIFGLFVYRWMNRKSGVRLKPQKIAPTAVALHRQMYTAFAEGDITTIQKICAMDLSDTLVARIYARGDTSIKWELIKYNKRPKVISHRAATMMQEGYGIRQAVVRICSKQTLARFSSNGELEPGSGKEKDIQEYVVIQRPLQPGKEGDWKIWGTVDEMDVETFEENEQRTLYD